MKALFLAASILFLSTFTAQAAAILKPMHEEQDVIRVVGTGSVEVMPDKTTVHMAIITKAKTSRQAQASNADEVKRLKEALTKKYQIDEKDFKTTSYIVSPEYNDEDPQQILGYTARHSLAITVYFTQDIGDLLDLAVSSGANSIEYIQWGLKDQRQYELEALKLAMQDAQLRAQAIAEAVNRPIKRVIRVSQGEYSVEANKEQAEDAGGGDIATEIYPEPVIVTATLNVEYGF